MARIYWRCNSGHYFGSVRCPFDGWSSDELTELSVAASRLKASGASPSIDVLPHEGVSESALKRAIVVEFGNEGSMFDAMSIDHYVINGRAVPLRKAGPDFN